MYPDTGGGRGLPSGAPSQGRGVSDVFVYVGWRATDMACGFLAWQSMSNLVLVGCLVGTPARLPVLEGSMWLRGVADGGNAKKPQAAIL